MKYIPIIYNAEEVRAIMAGTMTQTRRVMKNPPPPEWTPRVGFYHPTKIDRDGMEYPGSEVYGASDEGYGRVCPFGPPGTRLWVRETWAIKAKGDYREGRYLLFHDGQWLEGDALLLSYPAGRVPMTPIYRADGGHTPPFWRPSVHMLRWASRLTIENVGVRVESDGDKWFWVMDHKLIGGVA